MKLLIIWIFILSFNCYADNYICLVNPVTSEVTDIVADTPKNRETWESIKGTRIVEAFKSDKLEATPYIWSGDNIAVNQVKVDAKEAELLEQQAIEAKLKEMALVEIAKATEIKEVVK